MIDKQWRPVEFDAAKPGAYVPQPPITKQVEWVKVADTPLTWIGDLEYEMPPTDDKPAWKLPAWMTADWPGEDDTDAETGAWWPTFVICLLALIVVVVSLQPWAWH